MRLRRRSTVIASLFVLPLLQLTPVAVNASRDDVRLVVLVVVDQLRGDFLARYEDRFEKDGGFQRFVSSGVIFEHAFHDHAVTQTAPGHASIITGTNPSYHGIVGNDWFDRQQNQRVNAVYDYATHIVGVESDGPGRSPRYLRTTTIGDEMVIASSGLAKVLAVSGKDRSAVLTAGHLGKAYWYNSGTGTFVSSSYYFENGELPKWASDANETISLLKPSEWALSLPIDAYERGAVDSRSAELGPVVSNVEFPHDLPSDPDGRYFWSLKLTPYLDRKTIDFAKAAMLGAGLGKDMIADLLVLNLPSTDYVGHYYGWNSLEAEDNFLTLDRVLGEFFEQVENEIGAGKTLFVLTSDHGTDLIPAYKKSLGLPAHRLVDTEVLALANEKLADIYDVSDTLLVSFIVPNIYIDREAVKSNGLSFDDVRRAAVNVLEDMDGIAKAMPVGEHAVASDVRWSRLIGNSLDAERSGDIYVVQSHSTYLEWSDYTAAHGSPHHYDRHVPLMFFGPDIKRQRVRRQVTIPSLAPTISEYLGTPVPAYAAANSFHEITSSGEE